MSKAFLGFVVHTLTIAIVIIAMGLYWLMLEYQKPGPLIQDTLVEIPAGTGLGGIASILEKQNIIKEPEVFMIAARFLGVQGALKAGEYQIPKGSSSEEVLELLTDGKTYGRRFTIPEGLTMHEVVRRLDGIGELSGDITEPYPEGLVLPNTYQYRLGEDRRALLSEMHRQMVAVLNDLCGLQLNHEDILQQPCESGPLKTVKDVLTMASIIEKETGKSDERRKVAGVFVNRLKRNIPLQTDPTVIYAITQGQHENNGKGPLGRRLLKKDLKFDSPYNTYLYPGLPPGPIANPGKASIEAALNPEQHDYIYFVADGTGGHAFAKTLKEHNRNVSKWRKIRSGQN